MLFTLTLLFACQKQVRPIRTKIPRDWVHQPPINCGVGHCDLNVVDNDLRTSIDIATEYAQIHLAEKLSHHKLTVTDAGIIPLTDEMLDLEHHLLDEHTVVQEAVHIYLEHGVNSMYVLVCTEDPLPIE